MRNNRTQIQKIALLAMLTATAMILAYVEAILPPIWSAVPGVKVGLPNVIIIFVLYRFGLRSAAAVSLVRILLSSLLFGSPMSFLYSLAGAVLSLAVMMMLRKMNVFSTVGVSVAGGVFHNVGQIFAAMLLLRTAEIGYYMIVLAVTGTLAGVFVGLCGALLLARLKGKSMP